MTERCTLKAAVLAAFVFFLTIFSATAFASIDVSPVRVDLSDSHKTDTVRISNLEDSAKSYQVEVVAWSQSEERREIYSPTEELLAVPPLFTLQPGDEQVVRIGMLGDADPGVERSYRMFITELAPPQTEASEDTGVKMRLQIGIPVFVAPKALPTASLDYVDAMQVEDQLFMQFRNNGNTHIKVSEIQYSTTPLEEPIRTAAVFYVLPGQTGFLPVELPEGEVVGMVRFVTDTVGTLEYELPVTP